MLDLILVWKSHFQTALFGAALILAWRYAAAPEKLCAAILVATKVADVAFRSFSGSPSSFGSILFEYLALDLATLAAFLVIALRANRLYPLWLSSIQSVAVMGHFATGLKATAPIAYAVMAIFPSYLLVITVLLGIWAQARRTRRYGPTRAWRTSSTIEQDMLPDRSRAR